MRTRGAYELTAMCVNGKWLAQPLTGTQRYATEVMRVIGETAAASNVTLILPKDAVVPSWATKFRLVRSRFRGIVFEQLVLLWHARGKHLYSLAGPAPIAKRNQTLVMHDATPFRYPHTFRLSFVVWYRIMYGVLCRTAKRVLTVSAFSRTELAIALRAPERRFELAPCGADHVDRAALSNCVPAQQLQPGSFALIVGNLTPHKNVAAALTALSQADVPVAIVGGPHYVFRGAKFDDHSNVHFLGRVDDRQLMGLYAQAAVLVAPSRYEGFGIPIIEAGKLGCPAVFATGSAMTEVAGDGGLGFDPGDMSKCAELVKRVMLDPALRDELSTRAMANANRFSWTQTAQTVFAADFDLGAASDVEATADPLRVLHVTETFSAGTGTAIIGYARAIRDQGVQSWLLAQDRGSGLLEELGESSPFVRAQIVSPGLSNLWRAIGSSVEELRPDIVHLHSSLAGGVGRIRLGLNREPAVVYSPHGFAFERRDISRMHRWAYRQAELVLARRTSAFVCVSPHEAELARRFASDAKVVQVLNCLPPIGISSRDQPGAPLAPPRGADDPTMRVVTVGRVVAQKDPEMYAEIVQALRAGGPVEATWVGDGPARAALEDSGVAVTGWLPVCEVPGVVAGHTVYVHTAGWEAAPPIAVIDAMAAGLVVVVRRNPAYQSVLPEEWQFEDVTSAVRMIYGLDEEQVRRTRICQQSELLVKLRKSSPGVVLAPGYKRVVGTPWIATSVNASSADANGHADATGSKMEGGR